MRIDKKRQAPTNKNDFSSIIDESPWEAFIDKIKPLIKTVLVLGIISGIVYGGTLLFGNHNTPSPVTEDSTSGMSNNDKNNGDLAKCLSDSTATNPTPEPSDPQFYSKLISNYDKQISCYDKYPSADQTNKSNIEGLRRDAISARDGEAQPSNGVSGGSSTASSGSASNNTSTTASKFNPNACDSYKNEYDRLKGVADQLHTEIQKQLDSPVPPPQSTMDAWKEALDRQNKAYSDFQKCKAESYK